MEDIQFRFATPADAGAFATWAARNPQIPAKDVEAGMKENNPTATVLVIELHGEPILYVPIYCAVRIAYLGFNPDSTPAERLAAMDAMLPAIKAFAANFGITEINTLTKSNYPVAKWARKHGFSADDRELYAVKATEKD